MAGIYDVSQVGQRQDIADIVANIRADEMPFTSMVKKGGKPKQKLPTWQAEDYPAPDHAGVMDGADVDSYDSVGRGLLTGVVQKFRRPWFVSDFADETEVAGMADGEAGHQKAAAAKVLKMKMEARFLSNSECSLDNATDTANETRGAALWISNSAQSLYPVPEAYRNASAAIYSSTLAALTESAFTACLAAAFKERKGVLDLDGFVGIDLKTQMDNWTARDTEATSSAYPVRMFTQDAAKRAMVKCVDVFTFSAGTVRSHVSAYLYLDEAGAASAYTHRSGLFLYMPMWEAAFMRKPGMKELPDLGGGPRGYSDAMAVLKCLNPLGQVKVECSS